MFYYGYGLDSGYLLVIIAAISAIHITAFFFIILMQLWGIDATFVPLIILYFPSFSHKINTFTYFDTFTRICQYFSTNFFTKKAAGKNLLLFIWRCGWDSNPRYREVQLISSQSRYDHFDTTPYMLNS